MATFSIDFEVPDDGNDELARLTLDLPPYAAIPDDRRVDVLNAAIAAVHGGSGDVTIAVVTPAGQSRTTIAGDAVRGVPGDWHAGGDDAPAPAVWDEGDDPAVRDPFG
jgi:hypothetical protein